MLVAFSLNRVNLTRARFDEAVDALTALLEKAFDEQYRLDDEAKKETP